jgi:hypothetical protein
VQGLKVINLAAAPAPYAYVMQYESFNPLVCSAGTLACDPTIIILSSSCEAVAPALSPSIDMSAYAASHLCSQIPVISASRLTPPDNEVKQPSVLAGAGPRQYPASNRLCVRLTESSRRIAI